MSQKHHPKDIEQLLTDQTAVILEAVDNRLATQDKRLDRRFATQNRRIYGVEKKVDKVINQLDAVLKKSEDHREEDVSGAEQLRRHDDQLQDHAVRIKNRKPSAAVGRARLNRCAVGLNPSLSASRRHFVISTTRQISLPEYI